jgi:hypothetical protein
MAMEIWYEHDGDMINLSRCINIFPEDETQICFVFEPKKEFIQVFYPDEEYRDEEIEYIRQLIGVDHA